MKQLAIVTGASSGIGKAVAKSFLNSAMKPFLPTGTRTGCGRQKRDSVRGKAVLPAVKPMWRTPEASTR